MVRAIGAIANGGSFMTPTLLASSTPVSTSLGIAQHSLQVVREGMHLAAQPSGTAAAVSLPFVDVAGKTGTAQVGVKNEFLNSWVVGFYPYADPHYVFAVVLERGPAGTLFGAPAAMSDFFWWMKATMPQYLK
jgi:cell division protein FtsI/penicillin-binding protein 2